MRRFVHLVSSLFVAVLVGASLQAQAQGTPPPVINLGDFYFAINDSEPISFPPGTPPQSILTVTGAAEGEVILFFHNDTEETTHEVLSTLFLAASKVATVIRDAEGDLIAEIVGPSLTEFELGPGWTIKVEITLAEAVVEAMEKDPDREWTFDLSCFVPGHYEAGMRALITLKP